ncbi:hypothetical protein O181_007675 [Austropuccinia psidii MF-1]|uniref:Uncharacterized protein n=1 Tax=Austropuccinia psidii MF-1 TaxID=1389203 RepID=A0A9Q3BMW0_9BASI|nr:hypothetical protein [Austropuccinia psidii MF-1]
MGEYKQYYTFYNDENWEIFPQIHPEEMNSWNILRKLLKEAEIVNYSNQWNTLASKPQIKKNEGVPCQKEGGKKGKGTSRFYQKASSQPIVCHQGSWGKQGWPGNQK